MPAAFTWRYMLVGVWLLHWSILANKTATHDTVTINGAKEEIHVTEIRINATQQWLVTHDWYVCFQNVSCLLGHAWLIKFIHRWKCHANDFAGWYQTTRLFFTGKLPPKETHRRDGYMFYTLWICLFSHKVVPLAASSWSSKSNRAVGDLMPT